MINRNSRKGVSRRRAELVLAAVSVAAGIGAVGGPGVGGPREAGAQVTFVFTNSGSVPTDVQQGFQTAANIWSANLTTASPVTVRITIAYTALGSGIIGQAGSTTAGIGYSDVRNALIARAVSTDDAAAVASLPATTGLALRMNYTSTNPNGSGSATPWLDNNNSANNTSISVNWTQAKALGFVAGNDATTDANITFSSNFAFDFNPRDGISAGSTDFTGVAVHEIGHALGFRSGVDSLDVNSTQSPLSEDSFRMTLWDMFRFSNQSLALGAGVRDFTANADDKFASFDAGATNRGFLSEGSNRGDGRQASHWRDNISQGVMDPTAGSGELLTITEADRRAFDVMGWTRNNTWSWRFSDGGAFNGNNTNATPAAINWDAYGVPGAAQDARFRLSAVYTGNVTVNNNQTVRDLIVVNDTLTIAPNAANRAFTVSRDLIVGDSVSSTGSLTITNGTWTTSNTFIGRASSGSGTLSFTGGTWTNTGSVYVGGDATSALGTALLDDSSTGPVTINGLLRIYNFGRMNVSNGTMSAGSFDLRNGGQATINSGTFTVLTSSTLRGGSFTVAGGSASLGAVTVLQSGMLVSVAAAGSATVGSFLSSNGGTVVANGAFTVTGASTFNAASRIRGAGTFTATGGITAAANLNLNDSVLVLHRGTGSLTGGTLTLADTSRFTIDTGSVLSVAATGTVVSGTASTSFSNAGTLVFPTAGSRTISGQAISNTGSLRVLAGSLSSTAGVVNPGAVTVAAGASLTLASYVSVGGTLLSDGATSTTGSASLSGSAVVRGAGTFTVNGGLNITGPASLLDSVAVVHRGTGSFSGGPLTLGGTSRLTIDTDGLLNVTATGNLFGVGATGSVTNAGTFSVGPATVSAAFNNTGTFAVTSGSVSVTNLFRNAGIVTVAPGAGFVDNAFISDGGTLVSDSTVVSTGAILTGATFNNGSTVTGTGVVRLDPGGAVTYNGTTSFTGAVEVDQFGPAELTAGGRLLLAGTAAYDLAGELTLTATGAVVDAASGSPTFDVNSPNGRLMVLTPGTRTISLPTRTSVGGTLDLQAGDTTFTGPMSLPSGKIMVSGGSLSLSQLTVTGTGSVTVSAAGALTVGGYTGSGTFVADGPVTFTALADPNNATFRGTGTVTAQGGVSTTGGVINTLADSVTLLMQGTSTVATNGRWLLTGSSKLVVDAGGTLNVSSAGAGLSAAFTGVALVNHGALNFTGASLQTLRMTVQNTGTTTVSGTVDQVLAYSFLNSGALAVTGSAVAVLGTLVNTGSVSVAAGTIASATEYAQTGGSLSVDAIMSVFGQLTLSSATLSGTGTLAANGSLVLATPTTVGASLTLQHGGVSTLNEPLTLSPGAKLVNFGGSILTLSVTGTPVSGEVTNGGTVVFTGAGAQSLSAGWVNTGTVSVSPTSSLTMPGVVNTGEVIADGPVATSGTFGAGSLLAGASTVSFTGATTLSGPVSVSAAAVSQSGGAAVSLASGTVNFTGATTYTVGAGTTFTLAGADTAITRSPGAGASLTLFGSLSVSGTGSTTVGVPVLANGPVSNASGTLTFTGVVTAQPGNTVSNGGRLVFSGAGGSSIGPVSGTGVLAVTGGASVFTSATVVQSGVEATGAGVLTAPRVVATTVTISDAGSKLAMTADTGAPASVVGSLSISAGGLLDLADQDLVLTSTPLASARSLVASWYNAGARNGEGLGSSLPSAATPAVRDFYATLAVRSNDSGFGFSEFGSFSGVPVTATDVLVKYTYYGDTDLNGIVDARDVSRLLTGWSNGLTGWENGDTNYDGVVNGADYSLLLSALGFGGAPFTGGGPGWGGGAAIPEPTSVLLLLPLASLATRRRRG